MRVFAVAALLLSVTAAGCAKPQAEPWWDDEYPAWTPGWTLSYGAPADAESPSGHWLNFTFRGDEAVRHISHGDETANWTAHRMEISVWPRNPNEPNETVWYDVETLGVVQLSGPFTITASCPLEDMRIVTVREWTCHASSWTFTIRQASTGEAEVVLAGKSWTERRFDYRANVNNAIDEKSFAYSPELGFLTRMTGYSGSDREYVLQRIGACRGIDGMLMPDPFACGPWPKPSLSAPSTSGPTR